MRSSLPSVVLLAGLASAGCHTMRPVPMDQIGFVRPARIWVSHGDSVTVLTDPQIVNNRLAGFSDDVYHVIPTQDVRGVAVKRINPGPTAALVAAGAVGMFTAMWALSGTSDWQHPCTSLKATCNYNEIP